jgi:2-hydroxyacyl-CoA lyase 1
MIQLAHVSDPCIIGAYRWSFIEVMLWQPRHSLSCAHLYLCTTPTIMAPPTGAALIARALHELGVKVIFGLVGIPVVQIAEEAIALGIRFIAFRNEQAASYAATAYGYPTGRPGVCLVVGGPGVLHAMAGIGNASANAFPLLLLAGSSETHLVTKGAFQEMDAISLLTSHTKIAIRSSLDSIPQSLTNTFRGAWYGRGGPSFVDLPADVIQGEGEEVATRIVPAPPRAASDPKKIKSIVQLLKSARAPLVIVGKGAAYSQAEVVIGKLIDQTKIPFLPTPMGKSPSRFPPIKHRYRTICCSQGSRCSLDPGSKIELDPSLWGRPEMES